MIKDHVDLMIRFAMTLDDASYVAILLAMTPLALFASDKYLARKGDLSSIDDLGQHDCLLFSATRFGATWPLLIDGQPRKLQLP